MLLPNLSKKSLLNTSDFVGNSIKYVPLLFRQLSPHVKLFGCAIVENVPKKADYAKDLLHMTQQGIPVKKCAEILGMSPSYAYRLLRNQK